MNDSQDAEHLQILKSLLSSRRQWEQVPEIVKLAMTAITRILDENAQSFAEHKTLINEQSLKQNIFKSRLKEIELKFNSKAGKKEREGELFSILNLKEAKRDEDSLSEYQKLIKQSRYEREKYGSPTIEELKNIAEIIAEKQTEETKKEVNNKLHSQKIQIQNRIQVLKEEVKSRMLQIEREKRQLASQCRQAHSRIQQSQIRSFTTQNDEKINLLELSSKRMTEGLTNLVNHLQQNFLTKQEVNLLMEKQKEKKSPQKPKMKESQKLKQKDDYCDVIKDMQKIISKNRNEDRREWTQFKQNIMKQLGKTVNSEIINNLIDNFQKDILQKYQLLSVSVSKMQSKVNSLAKINQNYNKQQLVKSQKRAEKRSSPSKSIDSIQSSLIRLQKNILEKQNSLLQRSQQQIDKKIALYDQKLIRELDRRERHLCQVIEETYNQNLIQNNGNEKGNVMEALHKLMDTNQFCRYLYIGTRECKKENCIPWQKEALNYVVDNFIWKKDSSAILVNAAGLYKLEVGLFGDIDSESFLLMNGDPFADIPKPLKCKSSGIKIRGAIFSQFLLLPAKTKLSVRVGQNFYGQAFLSLQKL